MKRRKSSLFVALVLALSLALSPVSVFAEDLDTPVHEDPIDEIQNSTSWINQHFTLNASGIPVVFDVSAYCDYSWTEGIGGQINFVSISLINIKVDGVNSYVKRSQGPWRTSYNIWGKAYEYFWLNYSIIYDVKVEIDIYCDEYGDLSVNANAVLQLIP